MGNGASSKEVSNLVRKWERAIDDMNRLVKEHHVSHNTSPTAALSSGVPHRSPVNSSAGNAAMRRSFASDDGISSHEENGPKFTLGRGDQMIAAVAEEESNFSTSLAGSPSNAKKVNRQQAEIAKKSRTEFFSSYAMTEMELVAMTGRTAAAAPHFCTAAVALSYLLGGHRNGERRQDRVTLEDLFFAAEIPLVYLRQRAIELEEMFSIVRTFIETDTRFKAAFTADVCHLDIAPSIGQVSRDDSHLTGDRSCKVKQDDLRRLILHDLNTGDGVYIVNLDPYIVQQYIQQTANDTSQRSPSLPDSAFANTFVTAPSQQQRNDVDGIFCVVSGVREKVVSMVSLTEATLLGDSLLASHTIEVPFAALYAAMVDVGGHSQFRRSRGFIRVSRNTANPGPDANIDADGPSAFWSHELLSGTVTGRHNETSHARAIEDTIAHHLVAVAWTMHIIRGGMSDQDRYGTGLPVSDVIRTVRLPQDVFLNNDMPIDQVHMYLTAYIDAREETGKFDAELIPVICADRPGAVPSLTQHELQAILFEIGEANADVDVPAVVMLFQYNPLIAHNLLGLSCGSQWGILTGFDQDRQVARVLDANARMFGRSWTVTTDRLHEAITGYGYIVVRSTVALLRHSRCSGSLGSSLRVGTVQSALQEEEEEEQQDASGDPLHGTEGSGSKSSGGQQALMNTSMANAGRPPIGTLRKVTTDVQQRLDVVATHRRGVVEPGSTSLFPTFAFPTVPLPVTCVAAALTRTGIATDVDEVLQKSSFNCNDLVTPNIGLQAFCTITRDYLHATGHGKDFDIIPVHACPPQDYRPINPADGRRVPQLTSAADLLSILRKHLDEATRCAIVVHFSPKLITVVGGDRPFGDFGIVTAIHESDADGGALICVSDMHPGAFIRSWRISADDLFASLVHRDFTAERTKGFVLVRRVDPSSGELLQQHPRSRPLWLHVAPLYNVFLTSVSPQIQALSIAFAQLGFYYSPDEIFYIAYLKLNTASPRGRRNSQANAWRDVAATLTMLSTYVTAPLMEQLAARFLTSRRQKCLQVTSLHDISHEDLEGRLQEATNRDADHLLLVTYDVFIAHGIKGFGNSTAIVQSYSAEKQEVDLFDAEHVSFGLVWRCKLAVLMDATIKAGSTANGEEGLSIVMVKKIEPVPEKEDAEPTTETLIRGTFNPIAF